MARRRRPSRRRASLDRSSAARSSYASLDAWTGSSAAHQALHRAGAAARASLGVLIILLGACWRARGARRVARTARPRAAIELAPRSLLARRAVPGVRRGAGRPRPAVLARRRALFVTVDDLLHAAARAPWRRASCALVAAAPAAALGVIIARVPGTVPGPAAVRWKAPCSPASARSAGRSAASPRSGRSLYTLGATLLGIVDRLHAGAVGDAGHRAADHAHHQDAAERRDPDPDLRLRRRDLRRQPHRDPAQHSRHRGQRRRLPRRLRARAAGPGRAARWASPPPARCIGSLFGVVCLALFTPLARRGGAGLRRLRVLLARRCSAC